MEFNEALNKWQAEALEQIVRGILEELHRAEDNGHYLSGQGVAPGEKVPAVRARDIRQVLERHAPQWVVSYER